jgi:hypothetical protein
MDSEEGSVGLTPREQRRGVVLNQLLAGTLSHEQGALVLGLSVRQLRISRLVPSSNGAC